MQSVVFNYIIPVDELSFYISLKSVPFGLNLCVIISLKSVCNLLGKRTTKGARVISDEGKIKPNRG